jgi:hypothetical protein
VWLRTNTGSRVDIASYALLFLSDGRLFISRDGGAAVEADAFERSYVTFLLTLQGRGVLDPTRGPELLPPAES